MPWTSANPPNCAKNWPEAEKHACVVAGNKALRDGKSEEDAIYACIGAAKGVRAAQAVRASFRDAGDDDVIEVRFAGTAWRGIGAATFQLEGGERVPSRRFTKDVIRVGTYVKDSEGLIFRVSTDTILNWIVQFQRMRSNGVKVPIPAIHRDAKWENRARAGDPRNNMGWVDDMRFDRGTLWMDCTLIGEDSIVAANRSDVSLNSPPSFTDGTGNVYARPITHVAMVTDPVVPGLGEFIPIAASLRLQETVPMLEFLQRLAAMLGLDATAITDEATGTELVMKAIQDVLGKLGNGETGKTEVNVEGSKGDPAAPPAPVAEPVAATAVAPQVKRTVVSTEFTTSQSAMLASLTAENRSMKLSNLLAEGKITPEQMESLKARYCSDEAIVVELSAGSDAGFAAMLDILGKNPAVKRGERSGPQTLTLSDPSKAKPAPESPVVADAKRRAEAAAAKK